MTYNEYQKYLADGGWEAVAGLEAETRVLRGKIADLIAQYDDIEERLEKLERDEFISAGVIRRSVTVLGYCLIGLIMLGSVFGVASWLAGLL